MTAHDELLLHHALYHLEVRYWHEVDFNGGRGAHEFYLPDGLMVVGHNRFEGRDRIREFYEWRERQTATAVSSVKTMRHLINNLFVESSSGRSAKVLGIVSYYGSSSRPPAAQTRPPMLVADLINDCVLDEDDKWRFKSHILRPVFMGRDAPMSIAVDSRRRAESRS